MANTKIEWATKVWNPITGCTKISDGCKNCYAEKFANNRLRHNPKYTNGFAPSVHYDAYTEPLKWKNPERVFVCSMGDLFHEAIDFFDIEKVFTIMSLASEHTFLILTKRPKRLLEFIEYKRYQWPDWNPNNNICIGVSVENQKAADERIPLLLKVNANIRFISFEPLLQSIDITNYLEGINWIIVGGESGFNARPMHPDWVCALYLQAMAYEIPFFFKGWGNCLPISQLGKGQRGIVRTELDDKLQLVYTKLKKKDSQALLNGVEYKQFPKF